MSLRILIATHAPADSLTAVYRSHLARAEYLRREGHHVDVVTPKDLLRSRWSRLDPLALPPALVFHRLSRYDVAIFHSYMGWGFHALRPQLDPGRRLVTITSFHGLEPLYHDAVSREYQRTGRRLSTRFKLLHHVCLPRMLKASCRASDALFCLNSGEVDYLTSHRWADADRIFRVWNGVEPDCFVARPGTSRARRLLFVGQWLPGKGVRYLVTMFSTLLARRDVELACVGTGASPEEVSSSFPLEVRSRVSVVPRVDRAGLHRELGRADVFVFPTLSEGFSYALLEAMAAGLPVVATPAGAAADLLRDEGNAIVVPCADADALLRGVERVLDDAVLRDRLASAARQTATNYTEHAASARFAECVSQVVRRHALEHSRPLVIDRNVVS